MKGELKLFDCVVPETNKFEFGISNHDFCLILNIDDNLSLEEEMSNKKLFKKSMNYTKRFFLRNDFANKDVKNILDYIENNFDNIFDSIEYVKLCFDNIDDIDYIKKNPILLTKKIVIDEALSIKDIDKLMSLMERYKEFKDKIYVTLDGNVNYVSLMDCYKTMIAIKNQAEKISRLNLSPMENIMYAYDIVRNRFYINEDSTESSFKSRDLSEVLFGDKIVCAGYANMFCALLDYLNIPCEIVALHDKDKEGTGHARNIIYVRDEKYDIDGVYYFDPTWDRRQNESSDFLSRYTYFAKTKKFMDDDKNYNFEDTFLPNYSDNLDIKVENILEGEHDKLYPYVKTINKMSMLTEKCPIVDFLELMPEGPFYNRFNKERFQVLFKEVFSKFKREIPAETMIRLFINVRKLEYYENPELYPFDVAELYKTYRRSKWNFKEDYSRRIRLMANLFGEELSESKIDFEKYKIFVNKEGIIRELTGVRLAKVLKLVEEKKKEEE